VVSAVSEGNVIIWSLPYTHVLTLTVLSTIIDVFLMMIANEAWNFFILQLTANDCVLIGDAIIICLEIQCMTLSQWSADYPVT
jgi:hypothetical protein